MTSSSNIKAHSSLKFSSSTDILQYLKEHPHFIHIDAILAAITSGLLLSGGVVLAIVSGGSATPNIILSATLR